MAVPTAPPARPGTIRIAVILMYVAAILMVLYAIAGLASYSGFKKAYEQAFEGTSAASTAGSSAAIGVGTTVALGLVFGVAFGVLAIFVGRGKNAARIITWVFGGLALCCLGGSLASSALTESMYNSGSSANPDQPSYAKVADAMTANLPAWYTPVVVITVAGTLVLALAVVILLALPASHPYFRKAALAWEPPAGDPGYPGYPPAPPAAPDDRTTP